MEPALLAFCAWTNRVTHVGNSQSIDPVGAYRRNLPNYRSNKPIHWNRILDITSKQYDFRKREVLRKALFSWRIPCTLNGFFVLSFRWGYHEFVEMVQTILEKSYRIACKIRGSWLTSMLRWRRIHPSKPMSCSICSCLHIYLDSHNWILVRILLVMLALNTWNSKKNACFFFYRHTTKWRILNVKRNFT